MAWKRQRGEGGTAARTQVETAVPFWGVAAGVVGCPSDAAS